MAAMQAAIAAFGDRSQCRLRAVLAVVGAPDGQICCDRSNGGSEPKVYDAALRTNGGYQPSALVIFRATRQ